GLGAMASSHSADRQVAASIEAIAGEASIDGRSPVVLSWNRFLPQLLFQEFEDYEWVVPAREQLTVYAQRLARAGVDRLILVGPDTGGALDDLADVGWRPVVEGPPSPYDVVVLSRE